MATFASKIQFIPTVHDDVVAPKLTIGQRVKRASQRVITAVKSAVRAITRRAKTIAKTVATKAAPAAKAVSTIARKTGSSLVSAWHGVIRPFLKSWGKWMLAITWATSLLTAPLPTIAITAMAGIALMGLAWIVEQLQDSSNAIAKHALAVIEVIGQVLRAVLYSMSGALLILAVLVSPVLGALLVIELALRARRAAPRVAPVETVAAVEDLEIPTYVRQRQAIAVVEMDDTLAMPKSKGLRALGAEEMFDMPACPACGSIEPGARTRSMALPFVTEKTNLGAPHPTSEDMLCSECFDAECDDTAISLTGVSIKKTSTEVRLNNLGLSYTPEHAASVADVDSIHWTKSATAWWRDRNGDNHEREWSCFHNGKVVATVRFDYRRGIYRALALGKVVGGPQRGLTAAQRLASDELFDEGNAVSRLVQALGGLGTRENPAGFPATAEVG